ncbi:DUF2997 domain-containing protein [Asanoa sp. NPDC049573]|uniref:DUF2997 domain-containing protein n=1 Tax=Asanoa sp. NPDC049573 TaxID=3155396 RepID=UPI003423CBCC
MTTRPRITVVVAADGTVTAETGGVTGPGCLDYIAVLEDLLDATTVSSAYTADFGRATVAQPIEARDVVPDVERP